MVSTPQDLQYRSFLYRELESAGAVFGEVNGMAAAITYAEYSSDALVEEKQARSLGICDLSALARSGYKGWNIATWLQAQGAELPEESNTVKTQSDGIRIARLAPSEVLILGDLPGKGSLIDNIDSSWELETADGCFKVPRSSTNFWLTLSGQHAPELFAKICAVDIRPDSVAPGCVVQTNVARLNAIIICGCIGGVPVFDLLSDTASAVYLWRALLDAMDEFDGRPVGLTALQKLE